MRHDVFERHFVGLDDSGRAAGLDRHVRQRRAFVHRPVLQIFAGKLQHLADAFARLHVLGGEDVEHHVFRRDVSALLSFQNVTHGFRNANANVFRVPGVRHVS